MIINLSTSYIHHGADGMATSVLDLHLETDDQEERNRVLAAIRGALRPPIEEPVEKASRIGFAMDHGDGE